LAAVAGAGVLVAVSSAIEFARGNPTASIVLSDLGGEVPMFQGIQGNRNIMSFTLVLALWALIARVPERWPARALWCGALAVIVGCIYASGSTTGLAAVVGLAAVAVVLRLASGNASTGRARLRVWLIAAATAGMLLAAGIGVYLSLDRSFSRDLELSGRLELWQQILHVTRGRDLWVGHGWGTVWPYYWLRPPPRADLYDRIVQPLGVDFLHGHNSLLDPLPEIGLVGVALFVAGFVWVTVRAIRLHASATDPEHRLVARASLLGLTSLAVTGVTEPMSMNPIGVLVFALIAANIVAVGPEARRHARDASESISPD
jgi:O-antigen ligase